MAANARPSIEDIVREVFASKPPTISLPAGAKVPLPGGLTEETLLFFLELCNEIKASYVVKMVDAQNALEARLRVMAKVVERQQEDVAAVAKVFEKGRAQGSALIRRAQVRG